MNVIEAKFLQGVVERPLDVYLNDPNVIIRFWRAKWPNGTQVSWADRKKLTAWAVAHKGAGYDYLALVGIAWLLRKIKYVVALTVHRLQQMGVPVCQPLALGKLGMEEYQVSQMGVTLNPLDSKARYWCAELIRAGLEKVLKLFYSFCGIPDGAEAPGDIKEPEFDPIPRDQIENGDIFTVEYKDPGVIGHLIIYFTKNPSIQCGWLHDGPNE